MSKLTRRELILEAASEVFLTTGFEKSTVQEIADKAGVGKGTIYEYFSSKEALFVEMVQSYVSCLFDEMVTSLEQAGTIEELIDAHIKISLHHIEQHSDRVRILFNDLAQVSTDVHEWFAEKQLQLINRVTALIEQWIEEGELRDVNPEVVAWSIAEIIRLGFIYRFMYKKQDIEPILRAQKDLLLHGVRR